MRIITRRQRGKKKFNETKKGPKTSGTQQLRQNTSEAFKCSNRVETRSPNRE